MVKSTVRFPESVVEEVESLVEDGQFESKSEFYRFSTDYVLNQIIDGYEPETIDYDEIEAKVIPAGDRPTRTDDDELPFLESVALVRKFAARGQFTDAEDFIDHHYAAGDRHALLLEELLRLYRQDHAGDVGRSGLPAASTEPSRDRRPTPPDQ